MSIPIGKGKRFSTGNRFADYALGNWQLNSIFTWRNGQDYTVTDSADIANIGDDDYERANQVGNPNHSNKTKTEWFNTAAFAIPAQYTYGNGGRNTAASSEVDQSRHICHSLVPNQRTVPFRIPCGIL